MHTFPGAPELARRELEPLSGHIKRAYEHVFGDMLPGIQIGLQEVVENDGVFPNDRQDGYWRHLNRLVEKSDDYTFCLLSPLYREGNRFTCEQAPYFMFPALAEHNESFIEYFADSRFPRRAARYLHEVNHFITFLLADKPLPSVKAVAKGVGQLSGIPQHATDKVYAIMYDFNEAMADCVDRLILGEMGLDAGYWTERNGQEFADRSSKVARAVLEGDPRRNLLRFIREWHSEQYRDLYESVHPYSGTPILTTASLVARVDKRQLRELPTLDMPITSTYSISQK